MGWIKDTLGLIVDAFRGVESTRLRRKLEESETNEKAAIARAERAESENRKLREDKSRTPEQIERQQTETIEKLLNPDGLTSTQRLLRNFRKNDKSNS